MVSIRSRIVVTFLLLVGAGFYFFTGWVIDGLKTRYRESTEEPLVDISCLVASFLAQGAEEGRIRVEPLRAAVELARSRPLSARIYELLKTDFELRVYVTDRRGIVLYDSDGGEAEGEDYSNWNDVYLTLRGEYGARSTRLDPEDPASSVFYIGAPVLSGGEIIGAVSVGKSLANVNLFIRTARRNVLIAGLAVALALVVLGAAVTVFITRPISRLTRFARSTRDGGHPPPPRLGKNEIGELGAAMAEMREALEGKKYVERWVQTLAHEIKSPLASIRGAAELLEEEMPPGQRKRFLANIRKEEDRIRRMVQRLLDLASLENREGLERVERFDPAGEIEEIIESFQPLPRSVMIEFSERPSSPVPVEGERFLIRQAVANLLLNAVEFSPTGGRVRVALRRGEGVLAVVIEDAGPGIAEYARPRIFDKFYSLPRPGTGVKSSGLGLNLVREVAVLHGGDITLENLPGGGARAVLTFPA